MTFEAVLAACLSASVTVNIAFLLRESQLYRLRAELANQRVEDRHQVRNWVAAVELHLGLLRMAHNELVSRHHPQDADRLSVEHPPPFDATD